MSSPSDGAEGRRDQGADEHELGPGDWVTCFFSGRKILRSRALKVRLGPGQRVWMASELTRPG